jgi:hypothetical protein
MSQESLRPVYPCYEYQQFTPFIDGDHEDAVPV